MTASSGDVVAGRGNGSRRGDVAGTASSVSIATGSGNSEDVGDDGGKGRDDEGEQQDRPREEHPLPASLSDSASHTSVVLYMQRT